MISRNQKDHFRLWASWWKARQNLFSYRSIELRGWYIISIQNGKIKATLGDNKEQLLLVTILESTGLITVVSAGASIVFFLTAVKSPSRMYCSLTLIWVILMVWKSLFCLQLLFYLWWQYWDTSKSEKTEREYDLCVRCITKPFTDRNL
jgi:hypothetical protein